MLNVLIVDDDKLVRKGLAVTMPWSAFGMTIVGEAGNGVAALEFLQHRGVDLLVTDLVMPVMDGIELMRQVRSLYPHIWIVVLTFHQDFDLIQQALRLGAIDYIAKVQLEHENMDEVLGRIAERIRSGGPQPTREAPRQPAAGGDGKSALSLVLIATGGQADPERLTALPALRGEPLTSIAADIWLLERPSGDVATLTEQLEAAELHRHHWCALLLSGVPEGGPGEWYRLLHLYKEYVFFYEFKPDKDVYTITSDQLVAAGLQTLSPPPESSWLHLREGWSSLYWVTDNRVFESLLAETKQLRLPFSRLEGLLYAATVEWKRILPQDSFEQLHALEPYSSWHGVASRLSQIRRKLHSRLSRTYSDEVVQSVMKSVSFVQEHFSHEIRLSDALKVANMSRSYFSECFKEIMGRSFNDYLRSVRIAHARVLLRQTANPIYWVAEQCGYFNEKYFSRVFYEQTGTLPSEYRQSRE